MSVQVVVRDSSQTVEISHGASSHSSFCWHVGLSGINPETRAAVCWLRDDYGLLVRTAGPADLRASTLGTRWTNRELLFHMWFGQRIARVILPVAGGLSCPGGRR